MGLEHPLECPGGGGEEQSAHTETKKGDSKAKKGTKAAKTKETVAPAEGEAK
jgi:hypothetical protein